MTNMDDTRADKTSSTQSNKSYFSVEENEKVKLLPEKDKKKKLSWQLAILFVVGEVLGGGVVAIGDALANTGWWGILIMVIGLLANVYMTNILAQCVSISMDSTKKTRDPYTGTVQFALGAKSKRVTSIILYLFTICVTTVYLIISSELTIMFLNEFIPNLKNNNQLRIWLCVMALILIPITWFGTPSDFWGVALFAVVTTVTAAVLFSTNIWLNAPHDFSKVPERRVTTVTFFFGMGTILFGFCGIPFFPNIQSDMKNQEGFSKSAIISYIIIGFVYLPVAVFGMILLGDNINANIIFNALTIPNHAPTHMKHILKGLAYTSLILLAGHFLFAYNLIFNTMAQEIEEGLRIQKKFCWQRCVIRTLMVLVTLTLAQSIPRFDIILSLAGGTLLTPLSYHIPAILYCKLHSDASVTKKVIMAAIVVLGSIGCVGSVYANVVILFHFYKN